MMNEKSYMDELIDTLGAEFACLVCANVDRDAPSVSDTFDEQVALYLIDNVADETTLLAIAKVGTYIRYAANEFMKAIMGNDTFDPVVIFKDAMARKIEEDTVHEEDEAEVEALINETDEFIEELEDEIGEGDIDGIEPTNDTNIEEE